MKKSIKEWWKVVAGLLIITVLLALMIVSINLVTSEFSAKGGFHGIAVSIGKELKQIGEEIAED